MFLNECTPHSHRCVTEVHTGINCMKYERECQGKWRVILQVDTNGLRES